MSATDSSACDPEEWLDRHGNILFRFALARVRSAEAAEDLVQETFLAALAGRDGFRGAAEERTWLIGILRHKIVDLHRRRCREQPIADDEEVADPIADALFTPLGHWRRHPQAWRTAHQDAENREFWEVLRRCRSALPSRQAAVFTMRLIDDLPPESICDQLGISAANVCVLLHRARLRLRECLERRWFTKDTP